MRRFGKGFVIALVSLFGYLACPDIAFAQDTGGSVIKPPHPNAPTTGTPRENVSGGGIRARAPGLWTQWAISRHASRHQTIFAGGGGEPIPESALPPSRREVFLETMIQGLIDFFNDLLFAFEVAVGGGLDGLTLPVTDGDATDTGDASTTDTSSGGDTTGTGGDAATSDTSTDEEPTGTEDATGT